MPSKVSIVPAELLALVHGLLVEAGMKSTAKKLKSEADELPAVSGDSLLEIYTKHTASVPKDKKKKNDDAEKKKDEEASKKRKAAEASDEEEEEAVEAKKKDKKEKKEKKEKSSKKAKKEEEEEEEEETSKEAHKKEKKKKAKKEEEPEEDDEVSKHTRSHDDDDSEKKKKKDKDGGAGKKQQQQAAQSPSNVPFQRVKAEEVSYLKVKGGKAEELRLKDNTFESKNGDAYGAKASAILVQVRGKDFTREKNKKKKATYMGQIDMNSNSIKFEDSDDE